MLQDLGQNCKLFKMDLKNAFRLLPVNRNDFQLLGFKFHNKFFIDKSLPFGCAISCHTFEIFALKRRMDSGKLLHYLDDFLGGDRSYADCKKLMDTFRRCMA